MKGWIYFLVKQTATYELFFLDVDRVTQVELRGIRMANRII